MELRIKEILEAKGLRMADLAARLGTDQSNLKRSLSGNPTIEKLEDVARELGVEVPELFKSRAPFRASGIVSVDGKTYGIVERPNIVQLPSYFDYGSLRRDVKAFVGSCLRGKKAASFGAMVETFEIFSLSFDGREQFILSLYHGNRQQKTIVYDTMEYTIGVDTQYIPIDEISEAIQMDIEGAVC